jgi:hypothetical protein
MEFLVPLMPLFGMLPIAVAAVWIAHRILRHRERTAVANEEIDRLRQELEALRDSHVEVQERLDFTERLLAQIRDSQQRGRALP